MPRSDGTQLVGAPGRTRSAGGTPRTWLTKTYSLARRRAGRSVTSVGSVRGLGGGEQRAARSVPHRAALRPSNRPKLLRRRRSAARTGISSGAGGGSGDPVSPAGGRRRAPRGERAGRRPVVGRRRGRGVDAAHGSKVSTSGTSPRRAGAPPHAAPAGRRRCGAPPGGAGPGQRYDGEQASSSSGSPSSPPARARRTTSCGVEPPPCAGPTAARSARACPTSIADGVVAEAVVLEGVLPVLDAEDQELVGRRGAPGAEGRADPARDVAGQQPLHAWARRRSGGRPGQTPAAGAGDPVDADG